LIQTLPNTTKKHIEEELEYQRDRLGKLQERLYAEKA